MTKGDWTHEAPAVTTWRSQDDAPIWPKITVAGWCRVVMRGAPILVALLMGLALSLFVQLFERPLCAPHRPVSSWITRIVCRLVLFCVGIRLVVTGTPMRAHGGVVVNHTSWFDIFVLHARDRVSFVSKSDVAGWPGIGFLARVAGTVFINRKVADAGRQKDLFESNLLAGRKLLFFPEGTSTDGMQVLSFKSSLFAAFFTDHLKSVLSVQPVSVCYVAPQGVDPRFYGWFGDMDFAPHMLAMLALRRQGRVYVDYHTPLAVQDFADRKALARKAETMVRDGHTARRERGALSSYL